jgi:hypothetical protein
MINPICGRAKPYGEGRKAGWRVVDAGSPWPQG